MLRKLENGEGDLEIFEEDNSAVNVTKNQGRRIYTPAASQINDNTNEQALEDIENDNAKSLDKN